MSFASTSATWSHLVRVSSLISIRYPVTVDSPSTGGDQERVTVSREKVMTSRDGGGVGLAVKEERRYLIQLPGPHLIPIYKFPVFPCSTGNCPCIRVKKNHVWQVHF